jgi:hypothetical protein
MNFICFFFFFSSKIRLFENETLRFDTFFISGTNHESVKRCVLIVKTIFWAASFFPFFFQAKGWAGKDGQGSECATEVYKSGRVRSKQSRNEHWADLRRRAGRALRGDVPERAGAALRRRLGYRGPGEFHAQLDPL